MTAQNIIKQSVALSYVFSQPFATYIDAYPILQSQQLIEEGHRAIAYGDHSQAIRIIQHKLNDLNYYDETIDGEYGLFTEYALKKFQKDHSIEINGMINEETIQAIVDAEQEYYLDKLTSIDQPLYYGDRSEKIEALQRALFYLGFLEDKIDGIFGPITELALLEAQRSFGLEETPAVSRELVTTIVTEAKAEVEPQKAKPKPTAEKNAKEIQLEPIKKEVNKDLIDRVIVAAKSQTGVRYLWGGVSPTGFDCSGFIQFAFQQQGVSIPRTVTDMWNQSTPVDQPAIGDIVFFETYKKGPSHAGIYLGNGQFIHASESKGVMTSGLNENYWQARYLGSRRISLK